MTRNTMGPIKSATTRIRFLGARSIVQKLPDTRSFALKARILGAAGCDIAASARIHSRARFEGSNVTVGDDTWIGAEVFVAATPNACIQIGSRIDIAPRVTLVVGSHELGSAHRRAGAGKSLPITIGDGTWIGAGVLILGGVTIGEGCVIAAGAVVTNDVPPHTLAGGVPARVIKQL